MGAIQLPILNVLADKMKWHQQRQTLLAENVANAETPGYSARDLKAYAFETHLQDASAASMGTTVTSPMHIGVASRADDGFGTVAEGDFQVSPQGNAVNLEDEMMKVTSNQIDYQTVTALYTRSLRLIRTALGRQD